MSAGGRERPRLLFVGSFGVAGAIGHGGQLAACRALMGSELSTVCDVIPLDSTSPSVPPPGLANRLWRAILRTARLAAIVVRKRPDCALLFCGSGLSFIEKAWMVGLLRMAGVPALFFPRAGATIESARQSLLWRVVCRFVARCSHRLLCQGESWRSFWVSMGVSEAKLVVVENWLSEPAAPAHRDRTETSSQPIIIGYVGWLAEHKGTRDFVRAISQLAVERGLPDFVVRVVGGGELRDETQVALRSALGNERLDMVGWLPPTAVAESLRTLDVFVLPSHTEGMPNSLIEAMVAGVAPVATRVGCVGDMIVDRSTGLLVPARDPGALMVAIRELLVDATLRNRIANSARQDAVSRYTVEVAAGKILGEVRAASGGTP